MPPESARNATLRLNLDDGIQVQGCGFGVVKTVRGKVVFNTAITRYVEPSRTPL